MGPAGFNAVLEPPGITALLQDHGTSKYQGLTSSTTCFNSSFWTPHHPSAPSSVLLPHLMDVWIPTCWHPPNQHEWESPVNDSPDFSSPTKTSKRSLVGLTAPQHSEKRTRLCPAPHHALCSLCWKERQLCPVVTRHSCSAEVSPKVPVWHHNS